MTPLRLFDTEGILGGSEEARAFRPFTVSKVSTLFERSCMYGVPRWDTLIRRIGERWSDSVGACFAGEFGVGVLCAVTRGAGFDAARWRDVRLMRRYLRSTVRARLSLASADDAELVVTPNADIVGAPSSLDADTRELVRGAVRALERARSGADAVGEGDRIWSELLAGGWSVAERVERDGKRYLLLTSGANNPALALSDLERDLLQRLATGRSNKQIGMELGLSDSTVSARLRDALRKLGFKSAVDYLRHAERGGRASGPRGA